MSYKEKNHHWIAPSDFCLDKLEKLGFEDISYRLDDFPIFGNYKNGFSIDGDYEKNESHHSCENFMRYHLWKRELGEGEKEHECLHDDKEHIISSNTFADIIKAIKEKLA